MVQSLLLRLIEAGSTSPPSLLRRFLDAAVPLDAASRQGLVQPLDARGAGFGLAQVEGRQVGQPLQVFQSRVGQATAATGSMRGSIKREPCGAARPLIRIATAGNPSARASRSADSRLN